MNPVWHELVGGVFLKARRLAAGEREVYLNQACSGDEELRVEVESLLAAEAQKTNPLFRQDTPIAAGLTVDSAPREGERIGQYVIQRVIGSGGMGTVYEAMQERPRRRVALKTMRAGVLRPSAFRRFEYESQVLALLRHSGIAQVYEAGIHRSGSVEVPYFVMEFVADARPINEYARHQGLSIRELLELFVGVCEAVEHAHRNGVIHRDLKPENVLVDGAGQTKVIDFGIARLVQADEQRVTRHTTMGEVLGTLPYLSPEQAAGNSSRVDTRTDIYSLGVILYEALAGKLPYAVEGSLAETVRHILHVEATPPRSHNPLLDEEVETILLKCLQKDRDRRYQSAGELGRDIQRYLRGEAIEAKRDSGWYMLRKTVRRYRVQAAAAATVAILAAVSAIALSFMYSAQKMERRRAEQAAVVAQRASEEAAASRLLAEQRAEDAERQMYSACISAANHAITDTDAGEAMERLHMAPERFRGWEWSHLRKRADLSLLTLPSFPDYANHVAFSPEGASLAVGYESGDVRIWDMHRRMFTSEFRTFRRVLLGLTYASGGRIVAATEGGWSLLDGATGLEITRYEHLEGCEKPWDIDGVRSRIVFTLVDRGGVRDVLPRGFAVYNLETGELLMKRFGVLDPGHFESAAAFGPNGKQLATGHVDGIVRVWDLDSGQLLLASDEPLSRVYAIAYSPDGQQLISGHENGLVVVWDSASLRKIHNFAGHSQRVWKFAISSNNARLASMSHDKTIRLWNLSDGSPDAVLRGHSLGVTDGAFAPDGKLLATVSSVPKLWSIPHAPDAHRIQTSGPVEGLAFDATGARVVTTSGYSVAVWDADNGQRLHGWDDVQGAVACALFNRDGSQLILGRQDGSLRFLDIPACETTRNVPKHIESVRAMALSRNGQHMASGSWDGQVVLSDGLGAERHRLVGHNQPVHSVAFSPDDSVVASASADGTVKVWKVATGECILTYSEHTRDVYGVAVSPDGGEVASASYDGTFRIWDAWTGATLRTVDGKMQDVWSIAYSPDGTRLVTGARDRTVRIWDAETGEQLLILRGPTGTVMRVAWSPDGRRIAAGSWNDELFIWDAPPARH